MNINPIQSRKQDGFTLIEMLIYVAIFSMFAVTLSSFSSTINSSRVQSQVMLEVGDQGDATMRTITRTIRDSRAINSPSASSTAVALSITTSSASTNPTSFYVNAGVLYIQEGTQTAVALTNNKVSISNLTFSNTSLPTTPGIITIRFRVANMAPSSIPGGNYTADFYGSAALR